MAKKRAMWRPGLSARAMFEDYRGRRRLTDIIGTLEPFGLLNRD